MEIQRQFLGEDVTITQSEQKEYASKCTNYLTMQEHIMEFSKEQIIKAIVVEKLNRDRQNIINRLYARYSSIRQREEKRQLCAIFD